MELQSDCAHGQAAFGVMPAHLRAERKSSAHPSILNNSFFLQRRITMKKAIGILTILSGAALVAAGILALVQRPARVWRRSLTRHI